MIFNHKKVESSLQKKGFQPVKKKDHNVFVLIKENGSPSKIRTKTSHNKQDVDDYLISQMAAQTQLTRSDFIDLINCPLSKEEYFKKLKEKRCI